MLRKTFFSLTMVGGLAASSLVFAAGVSAGGQSGANTGPDMGMSSETNTRAVIVPGNDSPVATPGTGAGINTGNSAGMTGPGIINNPSIMPNSVNGEGSSVRSSGPAVEDRNNMGLFNGKSSPKNRRNTEGSPVVLPSIPSTGSETAVPEATPHPTPPAP